MGAGMEEWKKSAGGGEGKRIAFISCSKKKLQFPCRARELYQGELFKKSFFYCLGRFDQIIILSAKYGALNIDQIIEPYECSLNHFTKIQRVVWAVKVEAQLKEMKVWADEKYFFTGRRYCEFFIGHKPLSGLSLGRQLEWFAGKARKKGFFI